VGSNTNLATTTSGAIILQAGRHVDLKLADGVGTAQNNITAVGNLDITASTGQITRSDGEAVGATAKAIGLTYASTLDPSIQFAPVDSLSIAQSVGDLHTGSFNVPMLNLNAPSGNIIFAPGSTFDGGPINLGGVGNAVFNSGPVTFNSGFASTVPLSIGGASVLFNSTAAAPALTMNAGSATFAQAPSLSAVTLSGGTMTVTAGVQNISGGTWEAAGTAMLNLPAAGVIVKTGATLKASGTNIALPGDFTNETGATASLADVAIGGSLYNSGNFNVGGVVTVAGLQGQQLGGILTIPGGATLTMSNSSGVFSWQDGSISGAGTLDFSAGSKPLFPGGGDRIIDGLNFAFNSPELLDGSLTVKNGSLTLTGNTVLPVGVTLKLEGGTLTNNGTLDVAGAFSLTGGAFGGTGSLSLSGGSLSLPSNNLVAWTNSGTLTNTGTLDLANSTITNAIINQGIIHLGGGLTFTQAMSNTGTIDAQSGNAVFSGGLQQGGGNIVLTGSLQGAVTMNGGDILLNGGTLQGALTLNTGSIRGTGTVDGAVTVGNATMGPGSSPGSINITGALTLAPSSVLNIELGGLAPGSGHDVVNVGGTASLAGTLNVTQISGFVAPAGSNYAIINYQGGHVGAFSTVNLPLAPVPTLQYGPLAALLSIAAPTFAPEALLVVDPISIASQRILPMEELIAQFSVLAPSAQTEPEREIEVEGCR